MNLFVTMMSVNNYISLLDLIYFMPSGALILLFTDISSCTKIKVVKSVKTLHSCCYSIITREGF